MCPGIMKSGMCWKQYLSIYISEISTYTLRAANMSIYLDFKEPSKWDAVSIQVYGVS